VTQEIPRAVFNSKKAALSCYDHGMKKLIVLSLVLLFSASAFAQGHHHHHHRVAHHHHRAQ
jgi:hypothetical protein